MLRIPRIVPVLLAALGLAGTTSAQNDPSWTTPFEPFRVAGNLYDVGTRGVSSFLFVAPDQPYQTQLERERSKER